MQLEVITLKHPRTEHNDDDNEDALDDDRAHGLFAVSDGVGESSFAYEWSPLVVRQFLEQPLFSEDPFELEHWVRALQKSAAGKMTSPDSLPDLKKAKAKMGASATLLGLQLVPLDETSGEWTYRVIAIGDSNFFHWQRAEKGWRCAVAFPIAESSGFGKLPDSINSRSFDRDDIKAQVLPLAERHAIRAGDVLLLATDAVAKWIMRAIENPEQVGGDPMTQPNLGQFFYFPLEEATAEKLADRKQRWAEFILAARANRYMENDDSTLVIIKIIGTAPEPSIPPLNTTQADKDREGELAGMISLWLTSEARDTDVTLAFGDGTQLSAEFRRRLEEEVRVDGGQASHIMIWKANARAFKQVTDAVRRALRSPQERESLATIWSQAREQLLPLGWARPLAQTMRDLGIEQSPPPAPPPALSNDHSDKLRHAIGSWAAGTGTVASIIDTYDRAGGQIDADLDALINRPVPVANKVKVSHLQLWQAASGPKSALAEPMVDAPALEEPPSLTPANPGPVAHEPVIVVLPPEDSQPQPQTTVETEPPARSQPPQERPVLPNLDTQVVWPQGPSNPPAVVDPLEQPLSMRAAPVELDLVTPPKPKAPQPPDPTPAASANPAPMTAEQPAMPPVAAVTPPKAVPAASGPEPETKAAPRPHEEPQPPQPEILPTANPGRATPQADKNRAPGGGGLHGFMWTLIVLAWLVGIGMGWLLAITTSSSGTSTAVATQASATPGTGASQAEPSATPVPGAPSSLIAAPAQQFASYTQPSVAQLRLTKPGSHASWLLI